MPIIKGVPYNNYFNKLTPIENFEHPSRAELQMPLKRLYYELKNIVSGVKNGSRLYYGEKHEK